MTGFLMGDYERAFRISAVALAICSRLSNGGSTRFRSALIVFLGFDWVQVLARATVQGPSCRRQSSSALLEQDNHT